MAPAAAVVMHTPGPWTRRGTDVYGAGCLISRAPSVGTVAGSTVAGAVAQANVRLITAAPDMLAALHEVADDCYVLDGEPDSSAHCRFCDHSEGARHDVDCVMQFIAAAIEKAEGRA